MSNLTYIKTRVKNREHLYIALKSLGFSIREGSSLSVSNNYETKQVDFICIDPTSGREIGFFTNSDGVYSIAGGGIFGFDSKSIENEVVKIENRIKREYAKNIVMKKLSGQGFFLENESEHNDSIVIRLSRIV